MAQHPGGVFKQEPGPPVASDDHHHPHHSQQGPPPPHLHHSRPSSIVHQQHHQQQLPPQPQHPNPYSPAHGVPPYGQPTPTSAQHHPQELPYYAHPSPYSTPSASGTYSSGENPEVMATTQMSRPYPPISYHTPQSNSPASVNSPNTHDQHGRNIYGQPAAQLGQPMYQYPPSQPPYQPLPPQGNPSPYAPHPQHQQPQHPSMTSQPNLLMSHQPAQHQMQQQNHHQTMTNSPRPKMEHIPQMQRPPSGPLGPPQHTPNGPPMGNNAQAGGGANPNAAPGPIPATTPLVVRQDGNGVQWIAFEYSRDRVKMEYTIRCDVESVNVDNLSPEFKTENCVYPRACCSKELYRGNRLVYETECNTVGWALAELNACLRGKRGLIQRAVDSWRNSNQDSRLRSRRVRRMAKINNRKNVQNSTQHPHMTGPGGPPGMPPTTGMGPSGGPGSMGKPGLGSMGGPQLHHHHAHPDGNAQGGAEDVSGDGDYVDETHHHHHQAPSGQQQTSPDHVRSAQSYSGYSQGYPAPSAGGASTSTHAHDSMASTSHSSNALSAAAIAAKEEEEKKALFGDIPEGKKRKFILVDDTMRGNRVRVRVTLETVDIKEIPDSYRKSNSVYPRSWFPVQMQSPPPSATGSRFFENDDPDDAEESSGRHGSTRRTKTMVLVPMVEGEGEVATPKMRKSQRDKEVKLNELGYRMTWHQSRVFAGRIVFLQRALDCYRNKIRTTIDQTGQDVTVLWPHFETRAGKRKWAERSRRAKRDETP